MKTPSSSVIFDRLNQEQSEAVQYKDGPLLIVAGAGSGKTRVLTHRIAYFISSGISPETILAVTFTNKAAGVMRERIAFLTRTHVVCGTFHSIALSVLREHAEKLGFPPNFTIYDEQDQIVILKESMDEAGLDRDRFSPRGILESISRLKDDLVSPEEYVNNVHDRYEEVVSEAYVRYQRKLETLKGMDFGDLLMRAVGLLASNQDILGAYQERFRHIFVDEYQDTNHAQYMFVMNLARAHEDITVVGDPDQSIYAWRGADIRNILNFEKDFQNVKVVKLEQNYRSTSNILGGANAVIRNNAGRKEKNLWSARGEGELIQLYEARDDKAEARFVVSTIFNLMRQGKNLREMAVFYRTHAQSRVLEDELRKQKMPYKIVGGVRFYDRKEIKDLIAYLRVISAPYDSVSLRRIINVPPRGLGKKTLDILNTDQAAKDIPLYEVLESSDTLQKLSNKARQSVVDLKSLLDKCRSKLTSWDIATMLEKIVARTGYVNTLELEHSLEARIRLENIREFLTVIEEFQTEWHGRSTEGMLEAFLERISLASDIDRWNDSGEMLTLMTLHTAKGLEFPVVFMVGMEEGLCPYSAGDYGSIGDLEEERRLCYVGMTRARDLLYITFAEMRHLYGMHNSNRPSRFLSEIPTSVISFSSDCSDADTLAPDESASQRVEAAAGFNNSSEIMHDPFSDDEESSDDISIDISHI